MILVVDRLLMRLFMTESESLVSTSGRRDDEMPHEAKKTDCLFYVLQPLKVASDVFSEFLINFAQL